MKDERNHHGAVDKSFSEQRICIVDANYILYEKNWTHTQRGDTLIYPELRSLSSVKVLTC